MSENALAAWGFFHDYCLDSVQIGPNKEPRTITLGLYDRHGRAQITFSGVTCLCVENLGLLNIVSGIHVLDAREARYERAHAVLQRGERLVQRTAPLLVFVYSTLGAECAIECDSLSIVQI